MILFLSSCLGFLIWWTTVYTEISPYLPKLLLVKVYIIATENVREQVWSLVVHFPCFPIAGTVRGNGCPVFRQNRQSLYRETTSIILPQCGSELCFIHIPRGKNSNAPVSRCGYARDNFTLLITAVICWSFGICGYRWEWCKKQGHSTGESWRIPSLTSPPGSPTPDRQRSSMLRRTGRRQLTFQELCFRIWHFTFWFWESKDFGGTQGQNWSETFSLERSPIPSPLPHDSSRPEVPVQP